TASTRSGVTSWQPGRLVTASSPASSLITNRMSRNGAMYSAIASVSAVDGSELRGQLGHSLEQVRHQPVVGHLEDGCLGILVDGDDDLAVFHAGEVLYSAGDTDGDVELGRNHFASLPHLIVVGHEARIHCRARSTDRRSQLVGQCFEDIEILAVSHT